MFSRRLASALAARTISGAWSVGTATTAAPITAAPVPAPCGHGSPHATPGGVRCLAPDEYYSHKAGYTAAYSRAGFLCNSSGRLEYD